MRLLLCGTFFAVSAFAQFGRGGGDWMGPGADAQGTASVRTDPHISPESVKAGVMQLLWKIKLDGVPTAPVVASRLITYKGFKDLLYVGTSNDDVVSIDHTVGKIFWQTHMPFDTLLVQTKNGTSTCPAGMTAAVSLSVPLTPPPPPMPRGYGGPGRGGPGRGGAAAAPAPTMPRPRRTPGSVYALSSDGLIHSLNQHTGGDLSPAARFIRGNAKADDVVSVANVVYGLTSDGCGGAPNGVWSIDLKDNMVNEWKTGEASPIGLAFGSDGTVYVTTTKGIAALEEKTLKLKQERDGPYGTAPLVLKVGDKEYVAAGNVSGHVFLLDSKTLDLLVNVPGGGVSMGKALASWEDSETKTHWLLANRAGRVVAFKAVEKNGSVALDQAWQSRELAAPAPPIVVNGVVFVLDSGNASTPAVLHALDGTTGAELWNSGKSIEGYSTSGISSGASKVFVGTHDGTLYAFGYMMERE